MKKMSRNKNGRKRFKLNYIQLNPTNGFRKPNCGFKAKALVQLHPPLYISIAIFSIESLSLKMTLLIPANI